MSESHQVDIGDFCPRYEKAVSIISHRWTGLILRALLAGESRFSGISSYVPGLSDRLLSERLKELEAEQIVERRVYPETPVRIEYVLTSKGQELRNVVQVLQVWADRWMPVEPTVLSDYRSHPAPARIKGPEGPHLQK